MPTWYRLLMTSIHFSLTLNGSPALVVSKSAGSDAHAERRQGREQRHDLMRGSRTRDHQHDRKNKKKKKKKKKNKKKPTTKKKKKIKKRNNNKKKKKKKKKKKTKKLPTAGSKTARSRPVVEQFHRSTPPLSCVAFDNCPRVRIRRPVGIRLISLTPRHPCQPATR